MHRAECSWQLSWRKHDRGMVVEEKERGGGQWRGQGGKLKG